MKRFVLAIALTGALSATALAGEIPNTGTPAPAPTPAPKSASAPGDTPEISDITTSIVLTIISLIS